ncbi:Hsp20/alpha crystallin family protein [Planctomonas psychrotolerans]|uniref:Hsp20/alpha crystallin family protein n=1 Tax=Planctomonas psychrotolerans TaxID=2528712 RepID=UPI001238A7B0|nr:Hsp20/alpha crystallin family protein [Planctomonas psychrotolerans]
MARSIPRFNPLAELDALQRQFLGDDFLTKFRGTVLPTTDVYTENDSRLIVEAHLPNFSDSDIDVSIDEGSLVIQAEKHEKEEDKNKKYMVRESSASFHRRIALPDRADPDNIDAQFANGVLTVTVPFKQQPSPKKIAIKGAGDSSPATEVPLGTTDVGNADAGSISVDSTEEQPGSTS